MIGIEVFTISLGFYSDVPGMPGDILEVPRTPLRIHCLLAGSFPGGIWRISLGFNMKMSPECSLESPVSCLEGANNILDILLKSD